jgi:hypothetical protein
MEETSKITIHYLVQRTRSSKVINALISYDNAPHTIIVFHIPTDNRNNGLTPDAYACLIPILHCQQTLNTVQIHHHNQVFCNTKQVLKRLIQSSAQNQTPTLTYLPEVDLILAATTAAKSFHRISYLTHTDEPQSMSSLTQLRQLFRHHSEHNAWTSITSVYCVAQLQINSKRVPGDYT